MRPLRLAPFALAVSFVAAPMVGCKNKDKPSSDTAYEPPKRVAYSVEEYSSLCSGGAAFDGAPKYEKKSAAATPSKVVVFNKWVDDEKAAWKADKSDLGAIGAKTEDAAKVELVACVELKRKGEPMFCTYYGAQVKTFDMVHTVKIVEAATGKVIKEETYELDRRTAKCDSSVTGSFYRGTDHLPKLLSLLLPLQPEGVELPKVEPYRLDEVCSGSVFPQAAALPASGPKPVHLVYFPFAERSSTHEDPPEGLTFPTEEPSVDKIPLVACVTGKAQKKRAACEFSSGSVLELSDGEFEVRLVEARTGKVVETKSFKGTSGVCPITFKFYNKTDKVMTKVEPAFDAWLKKLQAG